MNRLLRSSIVFVVLASSLWSVQSSTPNRLQRLKKFLSDIESAFKSLAAVRTYGHEESAIGPLHGTDLSKWNHITHNETTLGPCDGCWSPLLWKGKLLVLRDVSGQAGIWRFPLEQHPIFPILGAMRIVGVDPDNDDAVLVGVSITADSGAVQRSVVVVNVAQGKVSETVAADFPLMSSGQIRGSQFLIDPIGSELRRVIRVVIKPHQDADWTSTMVEIANKTPVDRFDPIWDGEDIVYVRK